MLFSLYPTDDPGVRDAVVAQALAAAEASEIFTSLHIPESDRLREFGAYLARLHREHGLEFWADISPLTLTKLGIALDEVRALREWGVKGLRIDFGFSTEEILRIASVSGLRIAVNASTTTPEELDALASVDLVGWHNYYPRPETGLGPAFFAAQNALVLERGLDLFSFIPGETSFRAPLHRGLPTLEGQRHRNAYANAAELLALCPRTRIVCAEGTLLPDHAEWVRRLEASGEVTLPLADLDASWSDLLAGTWRVRAEQTGYSQRLEGTRGERLAARGVNADLRRLGSLQMDLPSLGRYAGELHLMSSDRPLDPGQVRVGSVAEPYLGLVSLLAGREVVRFVRW